MEKDSPLNQVAPDNSGSSTFERYRYQAKIAFPFVLDCGLSGSVLSVVPEHIEDILLEYKDHWRFLQVKTRDLGQGQWTLNRLTVGDSAPLKSLLRSFRETNHLSATYEAFLEHSLAQDAQALLSDEGRASPKCINATAKCLDIQRKECGAFLERLRIRANLPPRPNIDSENLILLQSHNPTWTLQKAQAMYRKALNTIEDAMALDVSQQHWPIAMEQESNNQADLLKKRLDGEACKDLLGSISGTANALLVRVLDDESARPTALEFKLLAAGASEDTIRNAKLLRAQADKIEYELTSSQTVSPRNVGTSGHKGLEDVRARLLIQHQALIASKSTGDSADKLWAQLLTELKSHPSQYDPKGLFQHDGFLLLGELCQMSDECLAGWS